MSSKPAAQKVGGMEGPDPLAPREPRALLTVQLYPYCLLQEMGGEVRGKEASLTQLGAALVAQQKTMEVR